MKELLSENFYSSYAPALQNCCFQILQLEFRTSHSTFYRYFRPSVTHPDIARLETPLVRDRKIENLVTKVTYIVFASLCKADTIGNLIQ